MGSEDLSGALMSSGWMRFLPLSVGLAIMAASVDAALGQLLDEHWLTGEDEGVAVASGLVAAGDPDAAEELAFATAKRDDVVSWWGSEGWGSVGDALAALRDRGWLDDKFRWCAMVLPHEVLELSAAERASEDELRWEGAFVRPAQQVIGLFDPNGERNTVVTGTLDELGEALGLEPETVRHALALLVGEGDFSVVPDVATSGCDLELVVTVDWGLFDDTRLTITG